jgi:hypothetical protein
VDEQTGLERYLDPNRGGINVWKEICLPNVAPSYRALGELIARERPDGVLAHFLCVGAHWAARAARVRCAIATLAPCWWCSSERPAVFAPQVPPRWLHRHLTWIARLAIDHSVSKPMEPVCRELDRPFRKDEYFRVFQRPSSTSGSGRRRCARPPATTPRTRGSSASRSCEATAAAAEEVRAFLESGPPPVVVGLGTSVRNLGPQLLPGLARACARLGRRSCSSAPSSPAAAGLALGARRALRRGLPVAEAIIHHGGMGTAAEALRAGKPTLVAPFASDQFDNALNAERAGVSRTLPAPGSTRPRGRGAREAARLRRDQGPRREAGRGPARRAPGPEEAARVLAEFLSARREPGREAVAPAVAPAPRRTARSALLAGRQGAGIKSEAPRGGGTVPAGLGCIDSDSLGYFLSRVPQLLTLAAVGHDEVPPRTQPLALQYLSPSDSLPL